MSNRIMLNETSYHGYGAIQEIANEAKARAYKKALVCSDPGNTQLTILNCLMLCRRLNNNVSIICSSALV